MFNTDVQPTVPSAPPHRPDIKVKTVVNTPAPPPSPTVPPKIYYKLREWDRKRGRWEWNKYQTTGIWQSNRAFYFPEESMPRLTMA